MAQNDYIYLLRHGQTDWNAEGRMLGWNDMPLNLRGRQQSEKTAHFLADKNISRVVCSPLARAKETAEIVAGRLPTAPPVEEDKRLKEFNLGYWEGMRLEELKADKKFQAYKEDPLLHPFPSGETLKDVFQRSWTCFEELTKKRKSGACLIVSHSGVIKLLLAGVLNLALRHFWIPQIGNASVSILLRSDEKLRIGAINIMPEGNYEEITL